MIEDIFSEAFIYNVLSSDATLIGATALDGKYIYPNRAPQSGAPYPLIVYSIYDESDVNSGNATRIFSRPVYRIRVVGKVIGSVLQDSARVKTAAHRMDELLKKIERRAFTSGGVNLFYNMWRLRRLPPPKEEPGNTADVFFRNYGGLYQVEIFE